MGRHRPEPEAGYRARYVEPFEFRHAAPKRGKRKLRSPLWARFCLFLGALLMLASSTAYGAQWLLTKRYDENITRADLLGSNRTNGAKIDGALTFLVLGTDKRTEEDYDPRDESSHMWAVDGERADTIMVIHIPKDQDSAYVISVPRDSDVYIPPSGDWEGGRDKLNAAYRWGGAPLVVSTVNRMLGIKIDYPVVMHFKAVREITDAVGGVTVTIDQDAFDPRTQRTWARGEHKLSGKDAEDYVRQRYGLDGSDYDRQKRQQQFVHAVTERIDAEGIAANPGKLDKLLRVVTGNLTVDHSMPVKDLVFSLKHLRPDNATYLNFPMAGSEEIDGVWYENVDEDVAKELGTAMRAATMQPFVSRYPQLKNDPTHGR